MSNHGCLLPLLLAYAIGCGSSGGEAQSSSVAGGGASSRSSSTTALGGASSNSGVGSGGTTASSRGKGGTTTSKGGSGDTSGGSTSGGSSAASTGGVAGGTGCGSLPDNLISKYHPTDASSTTSDTYSMNINDGSVDTVWKAASADKAWCWISLENSFDVDAFRLTFPSSGNYRYTIDVSSDGNQWKTVVDESESTSTDQVRCSTGKFPNIQTVRVSFIGGPSPALAELEVSGVNVQ